MTTMQNKRKMVFFNKNTPLSFINRRKPLPFLKRIKQKGGAVMNKLLLLFILILTGCNTGLVFSEVSMTNIPSDMQKSIESAKTENGCYLFTDEGKDMYAFLNGGNVIPGEEAAFFTDVKIEQHEDTLNIYFTENKTSEYSNEKLKHQLLYKITPHDSYEKIQLFRNGEPIPFDIVFGI